MSSPLVLDPVTIDPDLNGPMTFYFPAKALAVGASMAEIGQNDPIKVVKAPAGSSFEWKRVTGLHRLMGALAVEIAVRAYVVTGSDDELLAMRVSENLDRRDLEPLERSSLVAGMAEAAQRKVLAWHGVESQHALAGKARQNKVQYTDLEKVDEASAQHWTNLSTAYGWKQEVAEAWGVGPKDIQRAMRIHRMIIEPFPEMIDAFKDHPVAKVADSLLKIAAIKSEVSRRRVIEILLDGPKDLGMAMQMAGVTDVKLAPEPYAKFSSQVLGGWDRLTTAEKRKFIPDFAATIPAGMRALFREELDRLDGVKPNTVEHYTKLAVEAAEEAA
jgi:ParB family transcriptional regulator, chromosome partitioning protein